MKILNVKRIKSNENDGLEVEIENNGEIYKECFDNYEEWIKIEDGEEKFITRIKENYQNKLNPKIAVETEIIELKKFKDMEFKNEI